jgi:hypothetical protein
VSTLRGDESKSGSRGHGWQAVHLQGPWMRPGFQAEMVTRPSLEGPSSERVRLDPYQLNVDDGLKYFIQLKRGIQVPNRRVRCYVLISI